MDAAQRCLGLCLVKEHRSSPIQRERHRGKERELKVSAADSVEGNKKLKCLAISAKRVKMAVSSHFNILDDLTVIRISLSAREELFQTRNKPFVCTVWLELHNHQSRVYKAFGFPYQTHAQIRKPLHGSVFVAKLLKVLRGVIYQKYHLKMKGFLVDIILDFSS